MTTLTPFRIHDENHGLDTFRSASKSTRKKALGATTGPKKQGAKTGNRRALGDISNRNRSSLNYPGTQLRKGGSNVFEESLQKPTLPIQITAAKTKQVEPVINLPDDEEMLCTRFALEEDLSLCDSPPRMRFDLDPKALKMQQSNAAFSPLQFDIEALKEEINKLTQSVPVPANQVLEVPDLGPLPDLDDLDLQLDFDDADFGLF